MFEAGESMAFAVFQLAATFTLRRSIMHTLLKINTAGQVVTIGPVLDEDGVPHVTDDLVYGNFLIGKLGTWGPMSNCTIAHVTGDLQGNFTIAVVQADLSSYGSFCIALNVDGLAAPILRTSVVDVETYNALIANAAGGVDGLALSGASKKVAATVDIGI